MDLPNNRNKIEPSVTFSFIVPIYNAEKYLRQCLSSILFQTNGDWEAILVDDGSTDLSGLIADEFVARDPRFHIIHQKNQGTSGATNTALSIASGAYIINLDNDDYVSDILLEKTQALIDIYCPDVIQYPPVFITPDGDEIEKYSLIKQRHVAKTHDEMRSFLSLMGDGFLRSHSQKIIRRSLIQNLRFKGTSKGADVSFIRRLLFRCERAILEPEFLYYVRIRGDSETHRPMPPLLYKEWFRRELEDIDECICENVVRGHPMPFWEFDDLFDLLKLFSAKSIVDQAYDSSYFVWLFAELNKRKRYIIKNGFRHKLAFFAWKNFTKPLAKRLSTKIGANGQIF